MTVYHSLRLIGSYISKRALEDRLAKQGKLSDEQINYVRSIINELEKEPLKKQPKNNEELKKKMGTI